MFRKETPNKLNNKATFNELIELISVVITQDEYANEIEAEEKITVWAQIQGVYSSDYYNALGKGLKLAFVAKVHSFEYADQKYILYQGKKYKIERVFPDSNGLTELTGAEVVA